MSFLVDTDILSEWRKKTRNAGMMQWWEDTPPGHLFISVLSVGEIRRGATNVRERGDWRQAQAIEKWLAELFEPRLEQVLPITREIADTWGAQSTRRTIPSVDGLIAATATVHNLTMVTRNTRHLEHTGVRLLNPFSD